MKAVVNTIYGPPEVLAIKEIPKPVPKENEVLVKVFATTLNRTDCGFRNPEYLIVRILFGLFKPKKHVLGSEFAGEIESIGSKVTAFKPGDPVFGLSTMHFGTHAEYVCIPEKGSIALKPVNMTYEQSAAVCDGMMLAKNLIRKITFSKDDTDKTSILVNGATGSIGSACVQMAKYYGASVTAVCAGKHSALLKELGATEIIDYTKEDFTKQNKTYDYVIDAVGKSSYFKCKNILKPHGVYFSTELGYLSQNIYLALITPLMGGKKVLFPIPTDNQKDILYFKELIESKNYTAVIDRTYPLEEIIEATKYVETGEKIGNVVLTVSHESRALYQV